MKEVLNLSVAKLKRIIELKTQIERLQSQLASFASDSTPTAAKAPGKKRHTMSAAGRRKISLAAKARWAKVHAAKAKSPTAAKTSGKKKRTMSAAARNKISQAAKARWAKVRAAKSK
jgi:hypothetical protein